MSTIIDMESEEKVEEEPLLQEMQEEEEEEGEILEDGELVDDEEDGGRCEPAAPFVAPPAPLGPGAPLAPASDPSPGGRDKCAASTENNTSSSKDKTREKCPENKKQEDKMASSASANNESTSGRKASADQRAAGSSSSASTKNKDKDRRRRKRRKGRGESEGEEEESDNASNASGPTRNKKGRTRAERGGGWHGSRAGEAGGGDERKRSPSRSHSGSNSDGSDTNEEDMVLNEDLVRQMMQVMLMANKKGKKDKGMASLMEKMARNQGALDSKEMKEMVMKNKRLLRATSRERERDRGRSSPGGKRGMGPRDRERRGRLSERRTNLRERERDRERVRESRDRETGKEGQGQGRDRERERDRDTRFEGSRARGGPQEGTKNVNLCKFFLEGKCHKGADCPYSHDAPVAKKREICKFYLQGFCGKGDHCLFMHSEFPCKFFHTGAECYSGDKCRFSHEPLSEDNRAILRQYLDSGELPDDNPNNQNGANSGGHLTAPYQPMKPVPKRHAVLGEVTDEMRKSYFVWIWQQEMKELELAYTGNKRNLFCIERQFVIPERPPSPGESREPSQTQRESQEDADEREGPKVMSFYIDTMGENSRRQEDDRLIEMSQHDEDLRLPPNAPLPDAQEVHSTAEEPLTLGQVPSNDMSATTVAPAELHPESDGTGELPESALNFIKQIRGNQRLETALGVDSPKAPPNSGGFELDSELNRVNHEEAKGTVKVKKEKGDKGWLTESDDDTEDLPLQAAIRKLQGQEGLKQGAGASGQTGGPGAESKSKPKFDIAKMLNVIRQSTNQMSGGKASDPVPANKQADFWQNIFSGTNFTASGGQTQSQSQAESRDPRLGQTQAQVAAPPTPPQNEPRDPRLKRAKGDKSATAGAETLSGLTSNNEATPSTLQTVEIIPSSSGTGSDSEAEFRLHPVQVPDIDYSSYVSFYRTDSKLKNDPRLQKFFQKLPVSVVDHLSNLLPSTSKLTSSSSSTTTTLATLISSTCSTTPTAATKEKKGNLSKESIKSPPPSPLPPLPPLTLTLPKPIASVASIPSFVPPPPPIMSPFELITSKPSFTVTASAIKGEPKEAQSESIPSYADLPNICIKQSLEDPPPPPLLLTTGISSVLHEVRRDADSDESVERKPTVAHLPQGLTSLASLASSVVPKISSGLDLRKKIVTKKLIATAPNLPPMLVPQEPVVGSDTALSGPVEVTSTITATRMVTIKSPEREPASPTSSEGLSIVEDTPASPTAPRRSSTDGGTSPPPPLPPLVPAVAYASEGSDNDLDALTITTDPEAEAEAVVEPTELVVTPVAGSTPDTPDTESITDVFKTLDPTASPFC